MRSMLLLGLAGCALARICGAQTLTPAQAANPPVPVLVVRAAALIDGTGAQRRRDQEIVIRGNRITEVYAAGSHPLHRPARG